MVKTNPIFWTYATHYSVSWKFKYTKAGNKQLNSKSKTFALNNEYSRKKNSFINSRSWVWQEFTSRRT